MAGFAHSGWQLQEMDLFGSGSFVEISLSTFPPQGCLSFLQHRFTASDICLVIKKAFQRLREGALSWLDEYRRLVDETPTVLASQLHGHTDEVG